MNESQVRRKVLQNLTEGSFDTIHGSMYQRAGLPDIVGCLNGKYIGLEVKLLRRVPARPESLLFGSGYSFTLLQEKVAEEKIKAGAIIRGLTYIPQGRVFLMSPVLYHLDITVKDILGKKEEKSFRTFYVNAIPYSLIWRDGEKGFPFLQALKESV